jgi:hypothetical protein
MGFAGRGVLRLQSIRNDLDDVQKIQKAQKDSKTRKRTV